MFVEQKLFATLSSLLYVELMFQQNNFGSNVALHWINEAGKISLTDANNDDQKRHYNVVVICDLLCRLFLSTKHLQCLSFS